MRLKSNYFSMNAFQYWIIIHCVYIYIYIIQSSSQHRSDFFLLHSCSAVFWRCWTVAAQVLWEVYVSVMNVVFSSGETIHDTTRIWRTQHALLSGLHDQLLTGTNTTQKTRQSKTLCVTVKSHMIHPVLYNTLYSIQQKLFLSKHMFSLHTALFCILMVR